MLNLIFKGMFDLSVKVSITFLSWIIFMLNLAIAVSTHSVKEFMFLETIIFPLFLETVSFAYYEVFENSMAT